MSFFRNPFSSRGKSFAAPNSPSYRASRYGGNVDDLPFSESESGLQELWSEYSIDISNDGKFFRFTEAFLLFPHDQNNIIGHPTEVVHRLTFELMSFIQVQSTSDSLEVWTGEQYLFHARKDWKLKSTAVVAQITSWKGKGGEIILNHTNRRILLCVQCIVKLCTWKHNVELILNLFGYGFFGLLFLVLNPMLGKFDELIVRISDTTVSESESNNAGTVNSILYLLSLMFSIASIPSKLLLEDKASIYGNDLCLAALPPYRVHDLAEQDIDMILQMISFEAESVEFVEMSEQSAHMDPTQLRSIYARSRGPSSFLPAKQKTMDDIYSELIPNLSTLLRKLYLLSKITVDEAKRSAVHSDYLMDQLQKVVLIVQQEVLCAMTVIVYTLPHLLKEIKACEGFSTVMAFILCKDGGRGSKMQQNVYGLILRRTIMAIVFHDVCLRSSTKQNKAGSPISFISEVTNLLASLSALFAFIIENMNAELSYEHVLSAVIATLEGGKIECSCASSLNVVLPSTDLYPWKNEARLISKFHTVMTGMDEGSSGPAFTQALQTFWTARRSFFPTERRHIFEPIKSYIYAYLESFSESEHPKPSTGSSAWLNDPMRALFSTYSMTYLTHIFRALYKLVWRTAELDLECKEFDFFFECTISCFGAMSGNARTIGELGFVLQTIFFLMKSFEKFPEKAAILFGEKNYWSSLLENVLLSNSTLKTQMFTAKTEESVFHVSLQLQSASIPEAKSFSSLSEQAEGSSPIEQIESEPIRPRTKRPSKTNQINQLSRLFYYYKLFVADVIFEAIWISCTYSGLGETFYESSSSSPALKGDSSTQVTLGTEIDIVYDFLTNCKNDLVIIYCFRWLSSLVQFSSRLGILKSLPNWVNALEISIECLKVIAEASSPSKLSTDNSNSLMIKKLFQWPAKVSVLDFISKLIFSFNFSTWISAFIPNMNQSNGLALQMPYKGSSLLEASPDHKKPESSRQSFRTNRHLLLFNLVFDRHCQDYAIPIILRLLLGCAGSITKTNISSNQLEVSRSITMFDALAHDIVKNIMNSIKNHSQGTGENDRPKAAKSLLLGLVALLKSPKLFQCDGEAIIDTKKIRRLFYTYGTMTPLHKQYFCWSRPRPGVIKDMMLCLETSISAENTNHHSNHTYVDLVKGSIAFLTSLTYNSFRFQESLKVFAAQERRTKVSKVIINSVVINNWGINDLGFVILCALEWKQQFYVFFVLIIEMLLNGLPVELIKRARLVEESPSLDYTMTEEHAFCGIAESLIIQNTSALALLSLLLPYFAEREQLYVLRSILFLIKDCKGSLANITTCTKCKPSLIDYILDALDNLSAPAKVSASYLLRVLAQFSVSVSELKRMIRSLRPDRDRGEYFRESSLLLEALQGTIATESDPQFYFLFDGDQSGIILPSFESWPGGNGYTFSTWIHMYDWITDSSLNFALGSSQDRIIFSCRQVNGTGVDIYLSLQKGEDGLKLMLCMSVFFANRPHIPLKKSICNILTQENENRGKWVFIGVAHSKGGFINRSEVVAVVNAEVYHTELGYPRFTDDPKYACISSLHPSIDATFNSFRGRMSTVYFFSEFLSEQVLLSMYFQGILRSSELSETFDERTAENPSGSFYDIAVLEYNPSVTTSDLIIDTTVENIQSKWRPLETFDSKMSSSSLSSGKMHGKLMRGSHVVSSMAMKNALDCLGGSKVLFPLLYNANLAATNDSEVQKVRDQFVQMVTMIQNSLDKSLDSRRFMIHQGFAFLALFLESMDPTLISVPLVAQLTKFLNVYPDDDEWTRQCLKCLLCNFSLWVLTPFEAQEYLLRFLEVNVGNKTEPFREAVGVSYLFSVLFFQYSEHQLQRYQTIAGKAEPPSWVSRWNKYFSLDHDQLKIIRALMFQVIYQITMQSKSDISKEISSVVSYILHETNGGYKVDGMRLLIKLINPDKAELAKRLIDAFVTCKGTLIISHFCCHVRAKVRLYAWLVICNLITLALNCGILQTAAEATKYSSAAESNRRSTTIGINAKRRSVGSAAQLSKQVPVESAIDPLFYEKFLPNTKVELSVSGNVFSRLGVDESTIAAWFLYLSKGTTEVMIQHLLSNENHEEEVHIILQMLILTMFGHMSKFLLSDIEAMPLEPLVGTGSAKWKYSDAEKHPSDVVFDEIFNEHRLLSIPMMFPSLVEFFKFSRSSLEMRILFLQKVSSFIDGMENYDIFMSIPKWQSLLLDILVAERKHRENEQSDNAFDNLHILSSTIGTIFTKLHAHSVLCGDLRAPRYHIELPSVLSGPKYTDLDAKDLFEMIRKDQRILGCGGIRKTVAYIRSYISAGMLKWDRLCFDMLAMIVEGLHSAIHQVQEMATSDVDKDMRLRLFDINTWLTVECVGEFIAMPPVSFATKASNKSLTNLDLQQVQVESVVIPCPVPIRRVASAPPLVESNSNIDLQAVAGEARLLSEVPDNMGEIFFESNANVLSIEKEDKIDENKENVVESITDFDSVIMDHFSVPPTLHRRSTFDVWTPAIPNDMSQEPDEAISYNFDHAFDKTIWGTVCSMIDLLGITGKNLDSWFSQDRLWRLQAGFKVGFVRGRYVVKLVQESADSIMDELEPNSKVDGKNLTGKTHKHLLNRIVDQSIWLIIRILLNFAIQTDIEDPACITADSVSVQALLKLTLVLLWAKNHTKASFDNESLFVLAKLTLAMKSVNAADSGIWSQLALKVIDEILVSQTKYLAYCVQVYRSDGIVKLTKDFAAATATNNSSMKFVGFPTSPSSLISATYSDDEQRSSRPSFDIRAPANIDERSSFSSDASHSSMSFFLIGRIERTLQIKGSTKLTWAEWSTVMEAQLHASAEREKQLLSSKFDEVGLHKQSKEVQTQMEIYTRAVDDAIMYYTNAIDQAVQKLTLNEQRILRDVIRSEVQLKKKIGYEWEHMYGTLSNERGPWGSGAISDENKLWVLDPCEDGMRKKMKLITDDHGQGFLNIFLKKNASHGSSANLTDMIDDATAKPDVNTIRLLSREEEDYDSDNENPTQQSFRIANSELGLNIDMLKNLHRFRADSTTRSQSNPSGGEDFDSDEEFVENEDVESVDKGIEEDPSKIVRDYEKILFSEPCEVVLPSSNSVNPPASGILEVTMSYIKFIRTSDIYTRGSSLSEITAARGRRPESQACENLWACQPFPTTQWSTAEIVNIMQRYYQLRFVAMELFTTSRKVFFFNLFQYSVASRFQLVLRKIVKPPYMQPFIAKKPIRIIEKISGPTPGQSLTIAWANREISNFDYLMKLNTIAGRTYNDLGQYPIFPWILADYTSDVLNLRDKASFRDLCWPIGAQDPEQRQMIISKYYDLHSIYDPEDETSLPPFHYGTHYSVAGFVLWYLMRLEPYTSLHVQLQDGRIDRADRLLDSMAAAWKGCTSNPSDVKELIPELFYNPDILTNLNKVDFGNTQGQRKISDIVLPPWAKDPHDFIRKHRDALESEYVSKHLHHWIDLVFGCKQRPPHIPGGSQAAVDACNVFFHLTYENAVDLDKLRDSNPQLYIQYMCQIAEFGQSPCQLFTKEHKARAPLSKVDFIWPVASVVRGIHTIYDKEESVGMPRRVLCFKEVKVSIAPVLTLIEDEDRLITVDGTRIVGIHYWQINSPDAVPPFKFRMDQTAFDLSKGITGTVRFGGYNKANPLRERRLGVPFAPRQDQNHPSRYSSQKDEQQDLNARKEKAATLYRPLKIRFYEKEEKKETKKAVEYPAEIMGNASRFNTFPSEPSTPLPSTPIAGESGSPGESQTTSFYDEGGRINRTRSISADSVSTKQGFNLSTPSTPHTSQQSSTSQLPSNPMNLHSYYNALLSNHRAQPTLQDEHISSKNFAVLSDAKILFSCGHWDRSVRVTAIDSGRLVQSLRQHRDVVTCLAVAKDYGDRWLVTGSRDSTVIVWEIVVERGSFSSANPFRTLHGHDDVVSSVLIMPEIDALFSASEDGTIIIYNLRDGAYVRTIVNRAFDIDLHLFSFQSKPKAPQILKSPSDDNNNMGPSIALPQRRYSRPISYMSEKSDEEPRSRSASSAPSTFCNKTMAFQQIKISWLGYSKEGYIVVYSADYSRLTTFSLNGTFICSRRVPEALYSLILSDDGKVLLTGGSSCLVVFRWVHSLELANDGPRKGLECILDGSTADYNIPPFPSPIRTLHLSKHERHLLVGLETGELRILAHDPDYLRERLHHKLEELGIL